MNKEQVHEYVMKYLESKQCQIIEKAPDHVVAQLSPEADRELTNRHYYWNFVERTGAPPETMRLTFVFDAETYEQTKSKNKQQEKESMSQSDTILGRYLGISPLSGNQRSIQQDMTYGSQKLEQVFHVVGQKGRYVNLYEVPNKTSVSESIAYMSWLGVNFIVEFTCDLKRSEIHSLGICLSTGEIRTQFHESILKKDLTAKMPPNTHVRPMISLDRAISELHKNIVDKVKVLDQGWAVRAHERLREEIIRIETYYSNLVDAAEEEDKNEINILFKNRLEEIRQQYEPKIQVSIINCGFFSLLI
ncbi:YqhG family protein [Chengkuizengella axinellae]|uniref:YqhG family protein n=1 Tax=Chengkuizengella axinellae TaxID=3064388 RepID=A0ABT9IYZ1_9BACL|nr:YqhG family protein [Chengkuizengella sp. 2205SS18-9]MDP5274585.1 YqhG family protein [Chengkuizengella sp. 2205SS18-9]